MYAGRQYQAQVVTSESTRYVCMHCNFECDAMVTGIGDGTGRSPYFLDNAGARQRARDEAAVNARANMGWALRGARCPKCGKRDQGARRFVYMVSALRGLLFGAIAGVLPVAALKGSASGWGLGIAIALVVMIAMTVTRAQRMLEGAILHP